MSPRATAASLQRRLLGLHFLERRLREAKKANIARVWLALPPHLAKSDLPELDKPALCAAFEVVRLQRPPPGATAVDLFAVIESKPPHRTVLRLDPQGSWEEAFDWYRGQIVETSKAGWIGKKLNKPLSLALSTRLASTPLTPNQWTFLNLAVGLGSGWFVAQEGYGSVVFGALLFQLASVFDGVDGEIAKFRVEYTDVGAWLDTIGDNLALLAFLSGVGVHIYRYGNVEPVSLGTWVAVAGFALTVYLVVQLRFCTRKLHNASLAVWVGQYVARLPRRDPAVRLVLSTGRGLQKDFFSLAFLAIALTGHLELLLFGGTAVLVTALGCALYLNYRYAGILDG